jgi:hypothetical protein
MVLSREELSRALQHEIKILLQACGRAELGTINLWDGADPVKKG